MRFNKISRARNLLSDARRSIGRARLDPERYAVVISKMGEAYQIIDDAIAILDEGPKVTPTRKPSLDDFDKPGEKWGNA